MISDIIAFFVMLNPFALFLYLQPIMAELDNRTFTKVLFKASFISFVIYSIFALSGDFLFTNIFQINFESFRLFGGIIIFSFAYFFIVKGQKAFIIMKEDLDDLASEIALPFMVGAGTISLSILMSKSYAPHISIWFIMVALLLNFIFIGFMKYLRDNVMATVNLKVAFDKNMEILLRLNGFFVGSIGVNMMFTAIRNMFF